MLLITDLHFTDKEADRYRFKIFTWVHEYFKRTADKNLIILGDLTDAKDHHSANLVNSIVKRMLDLTEAGMEIFVLKGNHDYINPEMPYFGFLEHFEWIRYISEPRCITVDGLHCLFLPHTRNPIGEWKEDHIVEKYRKKADLVLCHESVIGSVTSSGYEMEQGLLPSYFRRFKGKVFSGDIHCPQTIGRVNYVGTPYSIRFNDHYRGRALAVAPDSYNQTSIAVTPLYPDIRGRWTLDVTSVKDFMDQVVGLRTLVGDQIKIRYELSEADEEKWDAIKKKLHMACKNLHVEISSLQVTRPEKLPIRGRKASELQKAFDVLLPKKVVDTFAKNKGLSKGQKAAGRKIIEGE